jgi:uroporphyrinogen decarboxylase
MMTERERYIATLTFQNADRVPFQPGHGRRSTLKAWHQQGLPPEIDDYNAYVCKLLGIPEAAPSGNQVTAGVSFLMIPQFEEKVLERKPGTLVVQDWKGNICEIGDEFDVTYLRTAIDFVTRKWIKCPVESRADWTDMARRYDSNDPKRFPADWAERCAKLKTRDYPSGFVVNGPFWQLREWLGFEGLCMMIMDDPDFVREMIAFWQQFVSRLLAKMLASYVPDWIVISEDMAYKSKPMVGPDQSREFLLPCWRAWVEQAKAAGVPILDCDSDGYVGDLIPVWIEAGIHCNSPQEVAAGNDLPAYRKKYGTQMAYRGGVDKRAMAKGGQAIRDEIARLTPTIEAGGFIPGCDHGIPFDVSWPNFVEYCRLLARATGWLTK